MTLYFSYSTSSSASNSSITSKMLSYRYSKCLQLLLYVIILVVVMKGDQNNHNNHMTLHSTRNELYGYKDANNHDNISSFGFDTTIMIEHNISYHDHHHRSLQQALPVSLPYRINCGSSTTGTLLDNNITKVWNRDIYFNTRTGSTVFNGCTRALNASIVLSTKDCLQRIGKRVEYNIPVSNNITTTTASSSLPSYSVTLHFMELFFNVSNRRIFNVSIEGISYIQNLDVFIKANGIYKSYIQHFIIHNVTDGIITINAIIATSRSDNNVALSGIEIELYNNTKPNTTIIVTSLPSKKPSSYPSRIPSKTPSIIPSYIPSYYPSHKPSLSKYYYPSSFPSYMTSMKPSRFKPSSHPSRLPSKTPSYIPSYIPSSTYYYPSSFPNHIPSMKPSRFPSRKPSSIPSRSPQQMPRTLLIVPVPLPYRINCGSTTTTTFMDNISNITKVWNRDIYFNVNTGSRTFNECTRVLNTSIVLSSKDCLQRTGTRVEYNIPVSNITTASSYYVTLHFMELFFNISNRRLFNVSIEGISYIHDLDVFVKANGIYKSYIQRFLINNVTDGIITINSIARINNVALSGIEIEAYTEPIAITTNSPSKKPSSNPSQSPSTLTNAFPGYLINCGAILPYIDSLARTWIPDQFYINDGSSSSTTISNSYMIDNTVDDILYQTERVGDSIIYTIPIPLVATYQVNLYFAETIYTLPNQRIFDIQIQNVTIQSNVDIIKLSSYVPKRSCRIQFVTIIKDGVLRIQLSKSNTYVDASIPTISAIEVKFDQPHISHSVATGPYIGTVNNNLINRVMIPLTGQTSHTHGEGLDIIQATWKEGNVILCKELNCNVNFTSGEHIVSLTVKDDGGNVDTEVTSVTILPYGYPTITQLIPNTGSSLGNYNTIIYGSGFNYTANDIIVLYGSSNTIFTGSNLTVINSTAIRIVVPPLLSLSSIEQEITISVQTPLGDSSVSTTTTTTNHDVFTYTGSIPIAWNSNLIFSYQNPTVGRFGPDQRLYIGTRRGRIIRLTMNADFTRTISSLVRYINNPGNEAILGITFDPLDTKSNPDVYYTFNGFFHKGDRSSSGKTIEGKICMASGPNLEIVTDIVTGLPISDLDHGLNTILFGDYGELYFISGSHTNGGIPGPLSSSRRLKENFLSAAINVAYLSHPDFNSTIKWSALDDGNMIATGIDVYAYGLRNPFGLMLHSNGNLYGTDNGPNFGYGRMSTGCNAEDSIDDAKRDDELLHIQKGYYYGHPNKKRATYFQDPMQCVWYPPEINSTGRYVAPLLTHQSSINGIMEYHSNHFNGQLRYNIITLRYNGLNNLHRAMLSSDGKSTRHKKLLPMNIGFLGLDITQAPNGNLIEMKYANNTIFQYQPLEVVTSQMIVNTVFPHRGPNGGGSQLLIYGVNFLKTYVNVTSTLITIVQVGNINCPIVLPRTNNRLNCLLPGGIGTVDVTVMIRQHNETGAILETSTFERGYRYITGILPSNIILPVYNGSS